MNNNLQIPLFLIPADSAIIGSLTWGKYQLEDIKEILEERAKKERVEYVLAFL